MPTVLHEALIEMFRHRPTLAAELLTGVLGLGLPTFGQARVDAGEFTDLTPTEYRADTVVVLSSDESPVLAIVVEVQMRRDGDTPAGATGARAGSGPRRHRRRAGPLVTGAGGPVGDRTGVVEGEANALLTVLETRGVHVTETARTRITECRDPEQLDTWLRRAITVDSVDALFA